MKIISEIFCKICVTLSSVVFSLGSVYTERLRQCCDDARLAISLRLNCNPNLSDKTQVKTMVLFSGLLMFKLEP